MARIRIDDLGPNEPLDPQVQAHFTGGTGNIQIIGTKIYAEDGRSVPQVHGDIVLKGKKILQN